VEPVPLLISLAALIIAAATFWRTQLKPARIAIDNLQTDIAGGGSGDGVPSFHQMKLTLAVSNDGARAGVITRIDLKNVWATGIPEFATGARERSPYYATPTIREVGGAPTLELPAGIGPGDVTAVVLAFELEGLSLTLANTRSLEEPNLTPLAVALRELETVKLEARVQYWATRGLRTGRREREATLLIDVLSERFRGPARKLWADQGRNRIIRILDE
jgi:hypothetical protein